MAALTSLITPLPYSADFRPYFTIHDPDFAAMANQQQGQQQQQQRQAQACSSDDAMPRLLGITNLYFIKARPACPYMFCLALPSSMPPSLTCW